MYKLPATHCPNEETCGKTCYELMTSHAHPHHYEDLDQEHFKIVWVSMEECRTNAFNTIKNENN